MAKKPIKTFERTIDTGSWCENYVRKGYCRDNYIRDWLYRQIRSITDKIREDEELPDKFQLILKLPKSIPGDRNSTIYLENDRIIGYIKKGFKNGDTLKYAGGSDRQKQSKTVSMKIDVQEDDRILLTALYRPKTRSMITERKVVSQFKPEFPIIVSASTEFISKGDMSTPGQEVKIEASIQSMSENHRFTTRKYLLDFENRVITLRKTGDVKGFGNQDEFFEHLIEDLS